MRIKANKVFKGTATIGWFYDFKLYIVITL
ncbi:MAG: hypothetical protein EAZ51_09045 [Sphingobacteriales bacterium]|nr:MAG: hypothetical protein EAZ64_00810 [Sphingobacteriales bacterium]TAF78665.1 MAG: hypothetical protein EAZ51_09045 [Sphingobacteriales bacterium]